MLLCSHLCLCTAAGAHSIDVLRGRVFVENLPRLLLLIDSARVVSDLLQVLGDVLVVRLNLVGDPRSIAPDRGADPMLEHF